MTELTIFPCTKENHCKYNQLTYVNWKQDIYVWPVFDVHPHIDILQASSQGRHHDHEYGRDQPPRMIFNILSLDDALNDAVCKCYHHYYFHNRNPKEKPWLKRPEGIR